MSLPPHTSVETSFHDPIETPHPPSSLVRILPTLPRPAGTAALPAQLPSATTKSTNGSTGPSSTEELPPKIKSRNSSSVSLGIVDSTTAGPEPVNDRADTAVPPAQVPRERQLTGSGRSRLVGSAPSRRDGPLITAASRHPRHFGSGNGGAQTAACASATMRRIWASISDWLVDARMGMGAYAALYI
ncbi:hypothetical protein BD779DRAFT_1533944 [Infundibulicybe gibba]|nr:hypothetical protein BD779DRAFT_1533944 [Infundibulicybe gibba]